MAEKRDGADATESIFAVVGGAADPAAHRLSALLGGGSNGGAILSALRAVAAHAEADSTGLQSLSAAEGLAVVSDLCSAGSDWAGGVCVVAFGGQCELSGAFAASAAGAISLLQPSISTMKRLRVVTFMMWMLPAMAAAAGASSVEEWQREREKILANVQLVMGEVPRDLQKIPLEMKVEDEAAVGELTRRKISYRTDAKTRVKAYLLIPRLAEGQKAAAVLCLHQTTRIGKDEPVGWGT